MQEGRNAGTKRPMGPVTIPKGDAAEDLQDEGKKRYYTPGEVMKKKGCIGCGGMVLSLLLLVSLLGWAIATL